jgi:PPOX class probable F420-dependent enzyme
MGRIVTGSLAPPARVPGSVAPALPVDTNLEDPRMAKLTENAAKLFRDRNWGVVITMRPDGTPHSTPVWIDTDGEHVIFNTAIGRAKERNLRRDPRVVITVLPSADPQSGYVTVEGPVEFIDEGAAEHLDRMAQKYLGEEKYPWPQPGQQRVIVRVTPERVEAYGVAAG